MADKNVNLRATDNTNIAVKYHDNGDSTYSETAYAATAPLPTGAATAAKQDTGNTSLAAIATSVAATLTVQGTVNVATPGDPILVSSASLAQDASVSATNTKLDAYLTGLQNITIPYFMGAAAYGHSFAHLVANATTTIKNASGVLHSLTVNTKGIGNTVTIKDNATVIAVIDTTITTTAFLYDVAFATSLVVVIAGGTAADITVAYR